MRYQEALIEALHPFGDVLEVGFGRSSSLIQKYHPRSHTIISADPKALEWSREFSSVKVIPDIWQGALSNLGVFDTIYFGIDPAENQFLLRFKYTDHDLESFCQQVVDKTPLSRFLSELEQNEQITSEQKEKMIRKYHLEEAKAPPFKRSDQMLQFLKMCLATHMRKGSRFACYLKSPLNDPQFFNEIVVDPAVDYREDGRIITIEKLS